MRNAVLTLISLWGFEKQQKSFLTFDRAGFKRRVRRATRRDHERVRSGRACSLQEVIRQVHTHTHIHTHTHTQWSANIMKCTVLNYTVFPNNNIGTDLAIVPNFSRRVLQVQTTRHSTAKSYWWSKAPNQQSFPKTVSTIGKRWVAEARSFMRYEASTWLLTRWLTVVWYLT